MHNVQQWKYKKTLLLNGGCDTDAFLLTGQTLYALVAMLEGMFSYLNDVTPDPQSTYPCMTHSENGLPSKMAAVHKVYCIFVYN